MMLSGAANTRELDDSNFKLSKAFAPSSSADMLTRLREESLETVSLGSPNRDNKERSNSELSTSISIPSLLAVRPATLRI